MHNNPIVIFFYRVYQLCICAPLIIIASIVTALLTVAGCLLGGGHFWGYYPGKYWSRFIVRILLLPVHVEGRENLEPHQSYVFVANHQGAFDIFLIYGFLNRNFKWMMKRQLRRIPFVGVACEASHQIFVDKRGPSKIKATYDKARKVLRDGMSLVVFPEGSRSFTGHMAHFRRGAFMLATELELPVVPLTINGSFDVMPRMRDMHWVLWHPLTLTIHKPISSKVSSEHDRHVMEEAWQSIQTSLYEPYRGFVENPDQ